LERIHRVDAAKNDKSELIDNSALKIDLFLFAEKAIFFQGIEREYSYAKLTQIHHQNR